ncbi:MAG: hypothetical protein OXH79_15980 [Boseongicola sp.]|nr:hypothetical protein [Boseongicola sp.]
MASLNRGTADAILDRLFHGAIRFELHGSSTRADSAEAGSGGRPGRHPEPVREGPVDSWTSPSRTDTVDVLQVAGVNAHEARTVRTEAGMPGDASPTS